MKPFFYLLLFLFPMMGKAQTYDVNYYLKQALKNSPLIHKTNNNNELISLDIKQVEAVLSKPKISMDGAITMAPIISHDNNRNRFEWVSNGAVNYSGYDLAFTDGGQYQAGVSVRQPLFRGAEYKTYTQQAKIARQTNNNNIKLTIHELRQLVTYQYILCLKSKNQIVLSQDFLQQMNQQVAMMKKLVASAIYKQTDLMLLEIEQSNALSNTKLFQSDYKNNLYDLNLLCGISDTSTVKLQDIQFNVKPPKAHASSFLITYAMDSAKIVANQNLFDQRYKPKLSLFATGGLNAVYLPNFNRLGVSTGLTFSWTLFDGHQRDIQHERSRINLNSLTFEKQVLEKQITVQRSKSLYQIGIYHARGELVQKQINQYNDLIAVYRRELSLGSVSIMDLKNLMREIYTKRQSLLLLKMQRQVAINSYNYWNY